MKRFNYIETYIIAIFMLLGMSTLYSCSDNSLSGDSDVSMPDSLKTIINLKVAVFTSEHDCASQERLAEIENWAKYNWEHSDMGVTVNLDVEHINTDAMTVEQLKDKATDMFSKNSYDAFIAPNDRDKMKVLQDICRREATSTFVKTTLIVPYNVSDDFTRTTEEQPEDLCTWVLGDSYATLVETATQVCSNDSCSSVAFLGDNDPCSQQFINDIDFDASERNCNVREKKTFSDGSSLLDEFGSLISNNTDSLEIIFAPYSSDNLTSALQKYNEIHEKHEAELKNEGMNDEELIELEADSRMPKLLIIDAQLSATDKENMKNYFSRGITVLSEVGDPTTGYTEAYRAKFNELPYNTSYFYDAFHLMIFAKCCEKLCKWDNEYLYHEIYRLVYQKGKQTYNSGWLPGMLYWEIYSEININEEFSDFLTVAGASGLLTTTNEPIIGYTTYERWTIYNGATTTIGTYSTNPDLTNQTINPMRTNGDGIEFLSTGDHWAVIVDASDEYRFCSSAYAFYKLLKDVYGFDDDHILFIADNTIVKDSTLYIQNPQGTFVKSYGYMNVYDGNAEIDYSPKSISTKTLIDAMTGNAEGKKISPKAEDNIAVFWFGHGSETGFDLYGKLFSKQDFQDLCNLLCPSETNRMYDKLFWFTEACHAGNTITENLAKPGMLFINSSSANETAAACNKSDQNFLCSECTYIMYNDLKEGDDITIYNLYKDIYNNAHGSHPQLINNAFVSTSKAYMRLFLPF